MRHCSWALPGRGPGSLAGLAFGPQDRAVDLVFLHANGFNARTYRTLLAPLAEHFHILAIDQRGHGATSLTAEVEGRDNWLDLRDDLLALLQALDAGPLVLAGHSMGGTASLLAAAAAPASVRALVLLDPVIVDAPAPAGPGSNPMMEGALRRRARYPDRAAALAAYTGRGAFRTWPEAVLRDYVEAGFLDLPDGEVTLACAPAWEASGFASHANDAVAAFFAATCPIRILRAERDSTCRLDGQAQALEATGRITIETVPDTSHFLPMERPDLARAAILAALQRPTA